MPPPRGNAKPPPPHDYRTTIFISICYLVLGVVFAGLDINLESTFMPPMPLKDPETIINSPHLATFAAAITSIASSVIVMIGSVVLRHVSYDNTIVAMVTFGTSVLNMVAQLIFLGIVNVNVATHLETRNVNDVKFVNGVYDTNGKQFTRETWSCTMASLFVQKEPWSTNACSEYVCCLPNILYLLAREVTDYVQHYARYTMIIMAVVSSWIVGIAYWPVRDSLFGDSKEPASKA